MNYAIRCILQRIKGFEVSGVPEDEVKKEILQNNPHILLIEVDFNKDYYFKLIENIRTNFPKIKIIVLIDLENKEKLIGFLHLQLNGYLLKNTSRHELIHAVNVVYKGDRFYSNGVQNLLHESVIEKYNPASANNNSLLSNREKEILKLITGGLNNKEIAEQLFISEHTAQTHRRNIMKKLNVNSTPQLILTSLKKNSHLLPD
jgi:DNA-binding NarL/FixJ family response regulator